MNGQKQSTKKGVPTDIDLANYARSYVVSYLSTVESESPQSIPMFARNHPYAIEVCWMPNGCFCLLFEKSEKSTITVSSQNWDYVMGKVMSGVSYLVTVYPHEGYSNKDATAKGRKDAIRDMRSLETSDVADSVRSLEKLIDELSDMANWNKNPVKMAEAAMSKLAPIRQGIEHAGPNIDMLSMVDALKNYPQIAGEVAVDEDVLKALTSVAKELGGLKELVTRVEAQDAKVQEVEKNLRNDLEEFKSTLDKKVAKGLGVILATTDRKIDKAIGMVATGSGEVDEPDDPRFDVLANGIASLKDQVAQIQIQPSVSPLPMEPVEVKIPEELVADLKQVHQELGKVGSRVKRIEDYLIAVSSAKARSR
jgi:rRNA-processing protein FCF1